MKKIIKSNYFRFNSIQFVIAIACIIVSILPMLYTGISMYTKFSNTLVESSRVAYDQIMDQLKINIEDYLEQGIKTTSDIHNLIIQNDNNVDFKLSSELHMFYSTRNNLASITIFDLSGNRLTSVPGHNLKAGYDVKNEVWFNKISQQEIMYSISEPHVQNVFVDQHPWVITISKPIEIQNKGRKEKAVLVVDMGIQTIHNICSNLNLGGRGYVYIRNSHDEIIYHPQQALVFAGLKEEFEINNINISNENWQVNQNGMGEEFLIVHKTLSFVDWNIVGVSYIDDIASNNTRIAREVLFTIPIILLIIIWLSWYISGKISQPIMKLGRYMRKVEEGNFNTQVIITNGEREVLQLADSFNVMVKKIKELIEENQREHEAKRQTELNALQAQINPHFLYNTLDSIIWMAESDQNEEVIELVTSLARFFRISISKGANIITVAEELEHARNYMLIQKIRYKDKFEFNITADEEVKSLKTMKLILQPMIENAIYHGIEYMVDQGDIQINAKIVEHFLLFEVIDNGLGISQEQLKKIREGKDNQTTKKKGNGVGVKNVDERIKLRFGRAYGLDIESELEEGTTVKLWLPIIRGDNI
ncbi:sensor histidine kinase [Vallitalea okinawensis]|uniref:sensor histidine kinase n=1 Tax=Vallitalea okinawensis TaxID=2078660 RepID=UPI000CFDB92A|nr:sensor histidine kinase [Vallitalea okinawensis]